MTSDVRAIVPLARAVTRDAALCHVAGEPALVRVVTGLLSARGVTAADVVVTADAALVEPATAALRGAGLNVAVVAVPDPATRRHCIAAGLERVGAAADPVILVHDHRSPLTSPAVVERVLARVAGGAEVAVPVLPVTDTVKAVSDSGAVLDTVDRTALRAVQYPRGYRASVLSSVLGRSSVAGDSGDEFAAALADGATIATVPGDPDAVAADLPADAALLEAIMAVRGAPRA